MCIIVLFDEQMAEIDLLDTPISALIESGVSNELVSLLAAIEEATCVDASPRYTQASVYELRRKLLCYNYGTAYYEVAHLLAIVTHFGGGIDETFWIEEAVQGDQLRHLTSNWPQSDALTTDGTLSINLKDRQFDFNWRRTNMIAAWTEFLLFILQPNLHSLLEGFEDKISGKQIDQLASELQKQTYSFLKSHLQPQHQLRECWQFLKWLKASDDNGSDYVQALDDDRVLTFWCQNAGSDPGDYRRFVSVCELAYDVIRSVDAGEQRWQLDHAASHSMTSNEGDDWISAMGNGEFAPEQDEAELFRLCDTEVDETAPATEQLASEELAAIKSLTTTDIQAARPLERPAQELNRLPLTHIRLHLFGKHQASITGDLQNHQGKNLPGLLACKDVRTPTAWSGELQALVTKINETRSAIAHILIEADEPAALSIIVDLNPEQAMFSQGDELSLNLLPEAVVQRCASSFKSINRQGFKNQPDTSMLPAYVLADQQLSRLTQGFDTLGPMISRYQDQFDTDRNTFSTAFTKLYGAGA